MSTVGAKIGFIGLGAMGLPMAINLVRGDHQVLGLDLSPQATAAFTQAGGSVATGVAQVMAHADLVFTMLPSGPDMLRLFEAADGLLAHSRPGQFVVDCSTIGVPSARRLHALAAGKGLRMLDAPVTGGVGGAQAGTLTIMLGGSTADVEAAMPLLRHMGSKLVHAGQAGAGQAAKVCNNMAAGIIKIAISEAFILSRKLGLDDQVFFDIASSGSAQAFALTKTCPVPGLVPGAPSSRDYSNGFATKLMLKDMKLAQEAALDAGAATVLAGAATHLFQLCVNAGHGEHDNSIVYQYLRGQDAVVPA